MKIVALLNHGFAHTLPICSWNSSSLSHKMPTLGSHPSASNMYMESLPRRNNTPIRARRGDWLCSSRAKTLHSQNQSRKTTKSLLFGEFVWGDVVRADVGAPGHGHGHACFCQRYTVHDTESHLRPLKLFFQNIMVAT